MIGRVTPKHKIKEIIQFPGDNSGTVVGENPTPYGILALWAVNELSIVYWVIDISVYEDYRKIVFHF